MKRYILLCLIFSVAGCNKAPEKEMVDARRAVHQAMIAGAEEYAPDELRAAQDALIETQSNIENKKYGIAKKLAILAKEKAEEAKYISKKNDHQNKEEVVGDE